MEALTMRSCFKRYNGADFLEAYRMDRKKYGAPAHNNAIPSMVLCRAWGKARDLAQGFLAACG